MSENDNSNLLNIKKYETEEITFLQYFSIKKKKNDSDF